MFLKHEAISNMGYNIILKLVIFIMMGCINVIGQSQESQSFSGRGEIILSYGVKSSNFETGPYERLITREIFIGNVSFKNKKTTEVFRFTAKGDIDTKQTVGISVAFEENKKEVYRLNQLIGSLNTLHFILAFDWEYHFIKTNWIRMYVGASFGVGYFLSGFQPAPRSRETDQPIYQTVFSYQVTPLGIRLGTTIAIITEFGYGYKGIINGGLSYSF